MLSLLPALTGALYAVAAAAFAVLLLRGAEPAGRLGTWVLAGAAALHGTLIASSLTAPGARGLDGIYPTLSVLSLVMVLAFLVTQRRYRTRVLGAFVTPVTLLFFLGASLGSGASTVSPEVRSALLPLHILVNVVGVAAFALSSAAAFAYLIQERLLRTKNVGGVFQRLPPLDHLDHLGTKALLVGFPLLTVGLVTGAFWIVRGEAGEARFLSPAQGFGVITWVVFAGVLILRTMAGWRGRRAAVGTLLGFASAAAALVAYVASAMGKGP